MHLFILSMKMSKVVASSNLMVFSARRCVLHSETFRSKACGFCKTFVLQVLGFKVHNKLLVAEQSGVKVTLPLEDFAN